ncbi:EamA family transporter [bacterium]|nr:EamA family transporter [bacterium]
MLWFSLAFLSAALSAGAAITQKKILFSRGALDFSVRLSQLTLLLTLPVLPFISFDAVQGTAVLLLFGKTLLGALAFLSVMQAIKTHELSEALPLMVLTPGLVALTAFLALGEALDVAQIAGMLLLLGGTYLLEMRAGSSPLHPFRVFFSSRQYFPIVAALLLFTTTSVLDRYLLTDLQMPILPMLLFQNLFLALHLSLIALIMRRSALPWRGDDTQKDLLLILLVALCTLGYRFSQIAAVSLAPVALVLAVKRLSVFLAAMTGGKLFRETDLGRKAVAILLLLAGAALIVHWW